MYYANTHTHTHTHAARAHTHFRIGSANVLLVLELLLIRYEDEAYGLLNKFLFASIKMYRDTSRARVKSIHFKVPQQAQGGEVTINRSSDFSIVGRFRQILHRNVHGRPIIFAQPL